VPARQALDAGIALFQYRNKQGSRREIYEEARRLSALMRGAGALFIVNDHADIALAVDAHGVHLGQDDLPIEEARKLLGQGRIIGISTHSLDQARAAASAGADYIGFGPIYRTTTKDAGPLQGLEWLRQVRNEVTIPIIAIGGINRDNAGEVLAAGADGIAVISAVLDAADPGAAAKALVRQTGRSPFLRH
jgi:thiamine-phosphate pyrophosphorylase